jgi:integrase
MHIKPIIKPSKVNKSGETVIFFRVTMKNEQTLVSSGLMVKPENWDKINGCFNKKGMNHVRLNALLNKKRNEHEKILLNESLINDSSSIDLVKKKIQGKSTEFDFIQYALKYVDKFKREDRFSMYRRSKSTVQKLIDFNGSDKLPISKLNIQYINKYEDYLITEKKNSFNTVASNFKLLKTILNLAFKEGLIEYQANPFIHRKNKTTKTTRTFLNEEEIKRMELLQLDSNKLEYHTRNLYIFAFYCAGIRVSDLLKLKWKDFDEKRINFTSLKTSHQHSILLPKKAVAILEIYRKIAVKNKRYNPENYIFPLLILSENGTPNQILLNAISSATARLNKTLKKIAKKLNISKPLSFHTSRHSFGTVSLRKNIPIQNVSKLLGHQNIRETQIYAKIVNEQLDESMKLFND